MHFVSVVGLLQGRAAQPIAIAGRLDYHYWNQIQLQLSITNAEVIIEETKILFPMHACMPVYNNI